MQFGQNLHRYQIVEWAPFYINYQALKERYKAADIHAVDRAEDADLRDCRAALEQELSKVRSFYKRQYELHQRKARAVYDHYNITAPYILGLANERETAELKAVFVELRDNVKRLLWFWVVNFDKILGALAKFQEDGVVSDLDLATRKQSIKDLCHINDCIQELQLKEDDRNGALSQAVFLRRHILEQKYDYLSLMNILIAVELHGPQDLDRQLRIGRDTSQIPEQDWQGFIFRILRVSVLSTVNGSRDCIDRLLSEIVSFQDLGDHIHWLISSIGRISVLQSRHGQAQDAVAAAIPVINDSEVVRHLTHIMARLAFKLEKPFWTEDCFGRTPLHHAVRYDVPKVCNEILKHMRGTRGAGSVGIQSPALFPDREGLTSLDLAVLNGNVATLTLLLEDHRSRTMKAKTDNQHSSQGKMLPGSLLMKALRMESLAIIRLLTRSVIDFKHRDLNGHTVLHLAVQSGKIEYVAEVLHQRSRNRGLDLNAQEVVYGWTPLILASAMGDLAVVELLLQAGADPTTQDHFGWKAKDHAAFRGWLPMAKKLDSLTREHPRDENELECLQKPRRPTAESSLSTNLTEQQSRKPSPNESYVFVNLGALDTYSPVTAVDLGPYVWPDQYDTQREADFFVTVSASDGHGSQNVVQLPIVENMANKPWRFVTKNAKDFKLTFKIFQSMTSGHRGDPLIGSAVALLGSLKQGLGPARESLIRDFTIPIIHKDTLNFIGTVTFYFLIMTPFPHPDPQQVVKQELLFPSSKGLPVIGHRGIGQNDPGRRQLQIGENTIESFLSAKDLGASYIEFDVQLTKDNVPIIYHDFLMSETGIDAPLHNLSLEQFKYISEAQSIEGDLPSIAEKRYLERNGDPAKDDFKQRSYSLNNFEQPRARSLIERMKHTFEFKLNESKGFDSYKGNIRSEYIQASFATLEDLLTKLPESVRFDIEIKYPMLFEAHDWGMETSAVEVNHLVDNVLDRVYRLAKNRTIFFSSFSPEVCILLSNKQHIYPVFFLTESGHIPSSDARADSLQEAIWFAKSWRLAGVISRSEPLVVSPQLIQYVKEAGLLCVSWGGLNDVPEHARTQAKAGLEAIITNSVRLICQTLEGENAGS